MRQLIYKKEHFPFSREYFQLMPKVWKFSFNIENPPHAVSYFNRNGLLQN